MTAAVETAAATSGAVVGLVEVRLALLFDPGTMRPPAEGSEEGCPRSGVVVASGRVQGVPTIAFATDPEQKGGALSAAGCARVVRVIDQAVERGWPVVGLWHSGGARVDEGVVGLDGVGAVFSAMVRASGRVPQISVVLGPAAGGAAYGPALTDVVIMSEAGHLFVTGPDVVRKVTGQDVTMSELGGHDPHARRSGVVHVVASDDNQALDRARTVVELLGRPGRVIPDALDPMSDPEPGQEDDPGRYLPERTKRAYDVRPLLRVLLDDPGLELQPDYAPNIVTVLGRLGGRAVGLVASNPIHIAGCLDAASAEKAARFVRTCDAFGVPLVVVVDVPGYMPGTDQEWNGVVRRGAKLLHAFAEASVPRVTVVTRKAFGGAYLAMNARSMGATAVFAWPTACIAVMGPEPAVDILHRRTLAAAPPSERAALHRRLVEDLARTTGVVEHAVSLGVVDEVIAPSSTRRRIAEVLAAAPSARGRHANIPL